jgi:two-component system LytT family response regulator
MIRTVLIDDEEDSIRVLKRLLENYCPRINIIGQADGVESGLRLIQTEKPDLVFLDIEMTRGNAFDLLNQLQPIDFQVIFVTAFDNYAIKVFKYSAVDYLLKPVDIENLCAAVERVMEKTNSNGLFDKIKVMMQNMETIHQTQQKMAIPTTSGFIFIQIVDMLRLEANGSYTNIFLDNGKQILATRNIKEYEDLLPSNSFCRIHNSHIINLNKIQKYQKGRGGYVTLDDGSSIEVASRRREDFLNRFLK